MNTESNTGRVAVITGASSGIGEATARALAADGYRVALLARRADRIQALADELGDGAIAIEADVTDRDSLVAAAQRVEDELGRVDVLINNAGVMLLAPFTSEQREEQRRMVEVNLLGAMTATEVFLDQLRDGGGDLVNISSVAGRTARPGNAAYAATKWGLNGWSESLRQELQPDVRVIVIEPGAVTTELVSHITHGETKQAIEQFYEATSITADDSPRSSPSPSPGRAASRSTRSSSGPPPRPSDGCRHDATTRLPPPRPRRRRRRGGRRVERLRSSDPRSRLGAGGGRILLAYFSRPGENYWNGGRRDLKVGNTEVLARAIRARLDCDVHRIEAADPYPADYDETVRRNVREQDADARPAIANPLASIDALRHDPARQPDLERPGADDHVDVRRALRLRGQDRPPVTTYAMSGLGTTPEDYARVVPRAHASAQASRSAARRHAPPGRTSTRGCAAPVCSTADSAHGAAADDERSMFGDLECEDGCGRACPWLAADASHRG